MNRLFKKTHTIILSLLLLMLLPCTNLHANSLETYFTMKLFGHSETSSITQIVKDDFKGSSFEGGKFSYTHNTWELGGRYQGFKLAAIARYDYSLEYSEDVAQLIYSDKNNIPIDTNRNYLIDLEAFHIRATGIKFGYLFSPRPDLKLGIDLSLLTSNSFLDGSINGRVAVSDDNYSGKIDLEQIYSTDKLLDRVTKTPEAQGYSVDVHLHWRPSDDVSLFASWIDLKSALTIDRAPFTVAQANSERVSLDASNKIDVKPILTGREGFRKYTLSYPKQFKLQSVYQASTSTNIGLEYYRYASQAFLSLLSEVSLNTQYTFTSAFDFKTLAVSLGFATQDWQMSVTSDKFDFHDAKTFGLMTSISIAL